MKWYNIADANPKLPHAGEPVLAELADGHAAVVALSVERNPTGGMLGLSWRLAHPVAQAAGAAAVMPLRWCRIPQSNIPQSNIRQAATDSGRPIVPEAPGQTHVAELA